MWTLILIISFSHIQTKAGYGAVAIDHIDGFRTQEACIEASRKLARERKDSSFSMHCVRKY